MKSTQEKQVVRFIEAAAGRAAAETLAGLPLDKDALQREIIEKGDELQAVFKQTLSQFLIKAQDQNNLYFNQMLEYWTSIWRELEIKNPDFAGITPFVAHPGYRPLILPKHKLITPQYIYDRCRERFGCWKWCDSSLDEVILRNDRDPRSGAYVAWFRDRVEADEDLMDMSANKLEQLKIPCITLLERELMEYDHFSRTGGHLDINNITLCSGSRDDDGFVPHVDWFDDRMRVYWCNPGHAGGFLRSRQQFTF